MKKIIVVLFLLFGCIQVLHAQYPIPSYNAVVDNRATFIEQSNSVKQISYTDSKRYIKILRKVFKTPSLDVTVFASSLDGQTTLGPFYIEPGQTISIEIDNREWGIVVFSEVEVVLDVWITEEDPPGGGEE